MKDLTSFEILLNSLNSNQRIYYIDRLLTEDEGHRLADILEDEGKTFSMTWNTDTNSYKITIND